MKTPPFYLIQSFIAFTEAKNMTEAAQSLQLSQPALTAHLKAFEEYFSRDVFTQQGRKKVLTQFGSELKDLLVLKFSSIAQDIKSLTDQHERPEKILVRVAGRGEILNYVAPRVNFLGSLHFFDTDGATASQGVLDRQYEIAISNHIAKAGSLHAKKLFMDHSALIIPKKWMSHKKSNLSTLLPELMEKPFLAYKGTERAFTNLTEHFNLRQTRQPHRVLANWPSLITMVELGQGWTLAPDRYQIGNNAVSIPVPASIIPETQFYALYRKESLSLTWFKELLEDIRQACN